MHLSLFWRRSLSLRPWLVNALAIRTPLPISRMMRQQEELRPEIERRLNIVQASDILELRAIEISE
jgi:hypothetical protein